MDVVKKLKGKEIRDGYLTFEDGTQFKGKLILKADHPALRDNQQLIWGEAAFTTSMTGYQETMTDPSYLGQHIIFAATQLGSYPINPNRFQSSKIHAASIICRHLSPDPESLEFWESIQTPILTEVDTRRLVKHMTQNPQHISHLSLRPNQKATYSTDKVYCNDLKRVSVAHNTVHIPGDNPIVLIDYGVKDSILKSLMTLEMPLVSVPHHSNLENILSFSPRMVFLSNGPGDPAAYTDQIKVIKELLNKNIPIRSICLGHQILSLALGAKSYRLPFGHRGSNHPVLDAVTDRVWITSQNHGYAIDEASLENILTTNKTEKVFFTAFKSLFDQSVEGLSSTDHTIKTVQFHPEAHPGPLDAMPFFTEIKDFLTNKNYENVDISQLHEPKDLKQLLAVKSSPYKKILVVGSGPIRIGQASEFDYSGTQACRALKGIGVNVVLLNSNPATIMTDKDQAYKTYIEPITVESIQKIIEKEQIDAILSTMGGQTALNICMELHHSGYLEERKIKLLGAKASTIDLTEDREKFAEVMKELGYSSGRRFRIKDRKEAHEKSQEIGFPLIIRRDFALGGKGAALVYDTMELNEVLNSDISYPLTIEKSLIGYKEVELEVMVDHCKNGVVICSIENVDPCGVHTGDSITVAPAMTISDSLYQKLRTMSLTIARRVEVVAGGANVQFAINPHDEEDIVVIEMNPRVSRSSALASKATGYPIAKISALLAVGFTLKDIINDITKASPVSFEPSLDYVAVKIPVFPFSKFPDSSQVLGPQMRSVGEVLAMGSNFCEAFMKGLRSLEIGLEIPSLYLVKGMPYEISDEFIRERLGNFYELSLLTVLQAFRRNFSLKEVANLSRISPWFLYQMQQFVGMEAEMRAYRGDDRCPPERFKEFKRFGFSDKFLAKLTDQTEEEIFEFRTKHQIFPTYKAVDTCSGEFIAETPYYYSTYLDNNESIPLSDDRTYVILGSGPNRIGQGIEFDYACVKACEALLKKQQYAVMVNSNPETVSTDYDSSSRLYLSPLYSEDLFDILTNENPQGILSTFSGQTGIKIREEIENSFRSKIQRHKFLGSPLKTLWLTEDRHEFDKIVKATGLSQTKSMEVKGYQKLLDAMIKIGFPVIIRPSYVIGGESMFIFYSHDDIHGLPAKVKKELQTSGTTFLVENYLENALEYDVDLIRDKKGNSIHAICEHIEYAGVHSGDSGMITPPVYLNKNLAVKLQKAAIDLASSLNIIGPVNFQFAIKDQQIYCIEANPRGSRTIPFLSKAYNLPLTYFAVQAMLGEEIPPIEMEHLKFFSVKQSTFPFDRFLADSILLGPKMKSTGETMGIDYDKDHAIIKSYLGNFPTLNQPGKILFSLSDYAKSIIIPYIKMLSRAGFTFIGTEGTADFIRKQGLDCETVVKIGNPDGHAKNIVDTLKTDLVQMVFNTPKNQIDSQSDGRLIRSTAILYNIPCFTREENIRAVMEALVGIQSHPIEPHSLQELYKEGENQNHVNS